MSGKIKKLIDCIVHAKANGNQALYNLIKTRLMLKGINPDSYNFYSEDDSRIIEKLENFIADADLNICVTEVKKMDITIAYSSKKTVLEVVNDIKSHFEDFDSKMIIFFASSSFDPHEISKEMQDAFKDVNTIGCSTAGEIISGRMLKNSVVAMALSSNIVADIKVGVIENIKQHNKVPEVFSEFEKHFGKKMKELEFDQYVGMVLFDGLSRSEEKIMEKMGDLTNITFIGASAGDYLHFILPLYMQTEKPIQTLQ